MKFLNGLSLVYSALRILISAVSSTVCVQLKIRETRKRASSSFSIPGVCWSLLICLSVAISGQAGEAPPELPPSSIRLALKPEADGSPVRPPESMGDVIRLCLLQALSEEFVDEKNWGETTPRFDGVRVRGLRISKRERDVNHGFWHRYKAKLIQPEETFDVHIQQEAGADQSIRFTILIDLKARCETTFVLWTYGVKGINGTTTSDAKLQLRLVIDTKPQFKFSLDTPLPRLELSPQVVSLNLKLRDLDLHRVGVIGGSAATVMGDASRKVIEELLQQQEGRIKKKLQQQIDEIGSRK